MTTQENFAESALTPIPIPVPIAKVSFANQLSPAAKKKQKMPRAKITPRKRAANEALPPEADLWKRPTYVLGDGDIPQYQRPGSCHKHIPSLIGARTDAC